ncbi:MAG: helix-turn-helix transcriptional regulator [Lautropia sp.]|nr:helix-turn-helix transcriptional regulator [Lautropia sp.]
MPQQPPLTQLSLLTTTQLGAVLQAARKSRRMSQSALASRLGLSQSRVSHLELHPQELSLEQLLAWCAALDLELCVASREPASTPAASAPLDW